MIKDKGKSNSKLHKANKAKNDEFYTQLVDIEKELKYYKNQFRGKVVYCNCDDPFESNFFRYFVLNFKKLGLRRLITTNYRPSPMANIQLGLLGDDKPLTKSGGRPRTTANRFIVNEVHDMDDDGKFNLKDITQQLKTNKHNEWTPLEGDGDFRSDESINLLKQSDIVVTNPPFSLFREYIKQLVDYDKKFLIIGNMNAITYKEVFPLLKENKVWLGNNYKINAGAMFFEIPENIANLEQVREIKTNESGKKVYITRVQGVRWFTNLDHGRRHQPLPLMTEAEVIKFVTKKPFEKYDNYNAIDVSLVKNIPSDYDGIMGVPMSIFDKHSPEQFEILGSDYNVKEGLLPKLVNPKWTGKLDRGYVNNKRLYTRILIKHKKK